MEKPKFTPGKWWHAKPDKVLPVNNLLYAQAESIEYVLKKARGEK